MAIDEEDIKDAERDVEFEIKEIRTHLEWLETAWKTLQDMRKDV